MTLDTKAVKALQDLATQYAEPDMLMHLDSESAAMVSDHILAQPEALQKAIFNSHYGSVKNASQRLLNANEALLNASSENERLLRGVVTNAHDIFNSSMAEAGVSLNSILEKTNSTSTTLHSTKTQTHAESALSKFSDMSKTKMAVIGGSVALGAYAAYKYFSREHPEQVQNDSMQR